MVSDVANPGIGDGSTPEGLTAEDLRLGRKAVNVIRVAIVVALVACVAIAAFVFLNVPWNSRLPYDGRHDYSGKGIPMQIAMLPSLGLLLRMWWSGKKPDAHHMGKGSRVVAYITSGVLLAACVGGQSVMARGILEAGGYFAG